MLPLVTVTTSNMEHLGSTVNPRPAAPTDARRARWDGHRENRRAELVDAAIRAIHDLGAAVGMDDIAAAAHVSKPVLYRYFADKAELYLAVGQRVADALVRTLHAELQHEREPRAHLAAVIDTYLQAIEAEPELYRFVTRRSFADRPVERDLVSDYTAVIAAEVATVLTDRIHTPGLEPTQAAAWGHGVVGLVQAAGDWWLGQQAVSRAELTDHLTTLLWHGLAGPLRPPS